MKFYQSKIGYFVSLLYLFLATAITIYNLSQPPAGGNWIYLDFCGFAVYSLISPSLLTFGLLFESLGIPTLHLGCRFMMTADYLQLIFHLVMTAVYLYLIGYGIDWLIQRWRRL